MFRTCQGQFWDRKPGCCLPRDHGPWEALLGELLSHSPTAVVHSLPERPLGFSLHGSTPTFPTRRQGGAKQGCSGVEKRASSRGETLKVEKIIWRVFCQSPSATRWNFSVTPSTSSVYFYLICCQVLLLPLGRLL